MTTLLGNGIYSYSDAARLTGVPFARVRSWFQSQNEKHNSVFSSDYSELDSPTKLISFLDLTDLYVVGRLREQGFSLQKLRKVFTILKDDLNTPHPYSHHQLLSDGKTLFLRRKDKADEIVLTDILEKQHAINKVLDPYLNQIDWNPNTQLAEKWRIMDGVVVDPKRRFGKPILESTAMPTSVLYEAYLANNHDFEAVAAWYGINETDVEVAVRFEEKYSGKAA